jgi:DNA polymerase elongation subunit (family B)
MKNLLFFPLKWNTSFNTIRIYGVLENDDKLSCIQIKQYPSTFYVEIPQEWGSSEISLFVKQVEKVLENRRVRKCKIVEKRLFMGVHLDEQLNWKKYKMLEMEFDDEFLAKMCRDKLKTGILIDKFRSFKVHLDWVELWYQYALKYQLPVTNWLQICNAKPVNHKVSICDLEFEVKCTDVLSVPNPPTPPKLSILAYDIEVYSSIPNSFPQASRKDDEIFQISLVTEKCIILLSKFIVKPEVIVKKYSSDTREVIIEQVKSEYELLKSFVNWILKIQPMVTVGYNNMSFDNEYLFSRAETIGCWNFFQKLTLFKMSEATKRTMKWSSAAYSCQNFTYLSSEGITQLDLLPIIKNSKKLPKYSLDFVANEFLKKTKNDISPQEIFLAYKNCLDNPNSKHNIQKLTDVGDYCIQDSLLVLELVGALQICESLIAMASVTNCLIENLTLRGTQYKNMCLILEVTSKQDIIVDLPPKTHEKINYRGATVYEPICGLHENIVSFDFTSLYPSLMLTGNLCASTLIREDQIKFIPPEIRHTIEWDDHVGCEHDEKLILRKTTKIKFDEAKKRWINLAGQDSQAACESWHNFVQAENEFKKHEKYKPDPKKIFCGKNSFTWLKDSEDMPAGLQGKYAGIYPQILQMLLGKRKQVRKLLEGNKNLLSERKKSGDASPFEIKNLINTVNAQNALQTALKLVANSLYGFTGSSTSSIPCVPIAMCTTATGRQIIDKASVMIETMYQGRRIYGDTDSNYVKFDLKMLRPFILSTLTNPEEIVKWASMSDHEMLYNYASEVSQKLSAQLPKHLNIAFEDEIYFKWFIMGKKSYASISLEKDGTPSKKIKSKGILLVRRDNCTWVRRVYEKVLRLIFDKTSHEDIFLFVSDECIKLMNRHCLDISDLTVTKSVNDWGDCKVSVIEGKSKMGAYVIRDLPSDQFEKQAKLDKKQCANDEEFYLKSLPAHVRLVLKMKDRGVLISPGERLEYVVVNLRYHSNKNQVDIEYKQWFEKHGIEYNQTIQTIDYLHYIKNLCKAVDTLLQVYVAEYNYFDNNNVTVLNQIKKGKKMPLLGLVENKCSCCKCLETRPTGVFRKKLFKTYLDSLNRPDMFNFYLQMVAKNKMHGELLELFNPIIIQ